MAFDVSLRDPGTGFDIALAAAAGGDATVTLTSAAATTLVAHAPTVTGDALVDAAAAGRAATSATRPAGISPRDRTPPATIDGSDCAAWLSV